MEDIHVKKTHEIPWFGTPWRHVGPAVSFDGWTGAWGKANGSSGSCRRTWAATPGIRELTENKFLAGERRQSHYPIDTKH